MSEILSSSRMSYFFVIFLLAVSIASGCIVYLTLYIFFMPFNIILPVSIMISIIVGGLTKYYTDGNNNNHRIAKDKGGKEGEGEREGQDGDNSTQNTRGLVSHIIFSIIYIALLVISVIFFGLVNYPFHNELYEPWQQFTVFDTMKLVSAIGLSFFFPGYALINIIFSDRKKKQLKTLPKILLGYIVSMAITGFAGFITALLGFAVSDLKIAIIIIHVTVIVFFLQQLEIIPSTRILLKSWKNRHSFNPVRVWHKFPQDMPRLIVFGSLLALVVLFTYVVYNGVIVGDQWFHHGRALQFISGDYKAIVLSNIDFPYPPLLSAVLSSFFG